MWIFLSQIAVSWTCQFSGNTVDIREYDNKFAQNSPKIDNNSTL